MPLPGWSCHELFQRPPVEVDLEHLLAGGVLHLDLDAVIAQEW